MNTLASATKKTKRLERAADRIVRGAVRLENALYEYRFGITTHGLHNWRPGDWSHEEHLFYFATSYRRIFRVLNALRLSAHDTFVDLGCGKGRVTCCASLYHVGEVIGVEDVAELCAIAQRNLDLLHGKRAPARIINGRAEDFDCTKATVVYMFHSFGPKTLASVLSHLYEGLQLNRRELKIVYVNPVHENVLRETRWLERYDYWSAPRRLFNKVIHPVSFWRTRSSADTGAM